MPQLDPERAVSLKRVGLGRPDVRQLACGEGRARQARPMTGMTTATLWVLWTVSRPDQAAALHLRPDRARRVVVVTLHANKTHRIRMAREPSCDGAFAVKDFVAIVVWFCGWP